MKKIILLLILSIPFFSIAQKGPGGVGENDGTSTLKLWLDANQENGTNGIIYTTWNDRSGNGYNMTAGNGAVFTGAAANGYPAFTFNGSSRYFQRPYTADLSAAELTIFTEVNVTASNAWKAIVSNRDAPAGSTAGYILYARHTSNVLQFWNGTAGAGWQVINSGMSTVGTWANIMLLYENVASGKHLDINGTNLGTASHNKLANTARPFRVGAGRNESTTPDYYFRGDIGEVIIYNEVINEAQQIIINNYLAAKYGHALTSNDIFDEDDAGNGNHDHDVAGIGRLNASNQHTSAQGTGMVKIDNPSGLGNNEFLIWGHNGDTAKAYEYTDVPAGVQARFQREWRVSEVNAAGTAVDVGSVDIGFDLSGLGSVTASDLRLLVDTDNDGDFSDETPISGATLSGGLYTFSGVTALTNNVRFTIGTINITQTPLPVELVEFIANTLEGQAVSLDWKTASEVNNDYFTLEKSQDAINWTEIGQVNGAGNSKELVAYNFIDKYPYQGDNYYRLKQVDFDGKYEYSEIVFINFRNQEDSKIELKAYPIPTNGLLIVEGNSEELENIQIYNQFGEKVNMQVEFYETIDGVKELDVSGLSNGVYLLKSTTQSIKIIKQ